MFDSLTSRLQQVFRTLRGHGGLTEAQLDESLKEIRLALLEADVNYKVVKGFVQRIAERARGTDVMGSLTPGQQVVKVVRDELVRLLGAETAAIELGAEPPSVLMLVGLQGSGKTTTAGKLGRHLAALKHVPLLVPCDLARPAAVEQLRKVGTSAGVAVHDVGGQTHPVKVAKEGLKHARQRGYDVVIIDSAGRLHIDDALMSELEEMKAALEPSEVLLVADSMTGQDAVKSAAEFDKRLGLTGVIMTKLDGDARGGAALSVRSVTGKPIKFVGTGEHLDGLEPFHPDRMASRILGMGDVLSLIEKAEAHVDVEQARELQDKLRRDGFTLEDFRLQLKQVKRLGPLDQILQMIPGFDRLKGADLQVDESEFGRVEAVICSMTSKERADHTLLNGSRRKRIAKGSGVTVQDVNRLIKQFVEARNLMRQMQKGGLKGLKGLGRSRRPRGRR